MGAIADAWYVQLMNQERRSPKLAPDPNGPRTIPKYVPTKWAVLQVLTKNCSLSVKTIQELLGGLSYSRSKSVIQRALIRCQNFGLAQSTKNYRPIHYMWRLTERGRDVANTPPGKVVREPTSEKVRGAMAVATKWLSVDDLMQVIPNKSKSTIRKALRAEAGSTYKGSSIPGDSYRRTQWALQVADTTTWADAAPKLRPMTQKTKQKKAKSARAGGAVVTINPRYQGFPMCLSATTAAKPSLIQAVGDLVTSEFVPANKKFSAHDVTKRLRELLESSNTTTINPAETGTVHVKGKSVPRVNHEEVREIVHELFNQGVLTGYDRHHNGQFFEYDLVANIAAQAPASPTATSSPTTPVASPAPAGTDGSTYDGSSTI